MAHTVRLMDAAGTWYTEEYTTKREAQQRARAYVTRDGQTHYKTRRTPEGATKYYHSSGEREAIVEA